MTAWCSLYLPFADKRQLAEALRESLVTLGYQRFDPFGVMPGKAYPTAVRLFVAPPSPTLETSASAALPSATPEHTASATAPSATDDDWTRVIGTPDPALLPMLSLIAPVLLVELDGDQARIEAYAEGEASTVQMAFAPYVHHHDCIHLALEQTATYTSTLLGTVPLDALPDDVRELAQSRGIDMGQANAMFKRMSGTLAQKGVSGDPSELLRQPDWNSEGGSRIRALLDCLNIVNGLAPDFVTLRDAYALHERRRRSPNAKLYPGDAEALAAVPDALTYTPIYAGKP